MDKSIKEKQYTTALGALNLIKESYSWDIFNEITPSNTEENILCINSNTKQKILFSLNHSAKEVTLTYLQYDKTVKKEAKKTYQNAFNNKNYAEILEIRKQLYLDPNWILIDHNITDTKDIYETFYNNDLKRGITIHTNHKNKYATIKTTNKKHLKQLLGRKRTRSILKK